MNLKDQIKILYRQLWPSEFGFSGNFPNWKAAAAQTRGYEVLSIVEKVKESILKVKNNEAVYERDSVLFNQVQYSWPLLANLMWIAAKRGGKVDVMDFGGSLGSSYFQNRIYLNDLNVKWRVVEQRSFVDVGRAYLPETPLHFDYTITESIEKDGLPDVLILSCVLPYIEDPYKLLQDIMKYSIPHIIIDNNYFNYESKDRICIQKVDPSIYDASYPCWFLNYDKFRSLLAERYEIVSEHQNDLYSYLDGRKIVYRGLLAKLKS